MGQLKSGDTIQYHRVSLDDALNIRAEMERFLTDLSAFAIGQCKSDTIVPLSDSTLPQSTISGTWGKAFISSSKLVGSEDIITFRQVWDSRYVFNIRFLMAIHRVEMTSSWWSLVMENLILIIAAGFLPWSRPSRNREPQMKR